MLRVRGSGAAFGLAVETARKGLINGLGSNIGGSCGGANSGDGRVGIWDNCTSDCRGDGEKLSLIGHEAAGTASDA